MCYSPVSICHQSSVRTSNLTYIITQTMPFDSLGALYSKGRGKIPVRSPTTGMGQVKLCSFLYHLCHNCLRRLTTEKLCHSAGGMIHYTPVVFYILSCQQHLTALLYKSVDCDMKHHRLQVHWL